MPRLGLLLVIKLVSCLVIAQDLSELSRRPAAPDYTNLKMWISHPDKHDMADLVPGKGELMDNQENADVDVFFVYPTIYSKEKFQRNPWFADITHQPLNDQIGESTIKNQASVFNGSCKIYSPLYRQAHLDVFRMESVFKDSALSISYKDVKKAFEHYLENWNKGRPFIIAAHSQGTVHAARLIQEFIEGEDLQKRMVAAYLVGMPIKKSIYTEILPCGDSSETGCWISWNTYKKGYFPEEFSNTYMDCLSTNPLNWRTDDQPAAREDNKGGVLRKFDKIVPRVTDAQNYNGILWSEKPHFPGRIFLLTKRYHIADYNLFYMSIRSNVEERISNYLRNDSR